MLQIAHMPTNKHRSRGPSPTMVVVHAMGEFIEHGSTDYYAPDYLKTLGLSCHYFITPSGVIIQTVNVDDIAWHAKGFNADSIGIEFLVPGIHTYESFRQAIKTPQWLTEAAYDSGLALVVELRKRYQLSLHTHAELSPGRKFDPGPGFPWTRFCAEVNTYGI